MYLVVLCCYFYLLFKKIVIICIIFLLFYGVVMFYIFYILLIGEVVSGLWLYGNNLSVFIDSMVLGSYYVYYVNVKLLLFDFEGFFFIFLVIVSVLSGILVVVYLIK